MSSHPAVPLARMRIYADHVVNVLQPLCRRIEIGGSVRRGKAMCADIEIVCVPIIGYAHLDGELLPRHDVNLLDKYIRERLDPASELWAGMHLTRRLDVNGRSAVGDRYKRLAVDGVPLDLFSVLPPAQWGVIMVIRTGPAEFSQKMVTQIRKGGYLPDDCEVREGTVKRLGERLVLAEEADFFALCGMAWIAPEDRR